MLFTVVSNVNKNKKKVISYSIFIITGLMIWGCNQNKEFIKLDAPLEDILPKIILISPENHDNAGKKIEIIVGEKFSGEGEYAVSGIESHKFTYKLHSPHIVEGNRYIFGIVSYNWGGSGNFFYMTAVDKSTLKSVDEVLLGDRIVVNGFKLTTPRSDEISLTYMVRSSGAAMTAAPNKKVEMQYKMSQSKLIKNIE